MSDQATYWKARPTSNAWFAGRPFECSRFSAFPGDPHGRPVLEWTRIYVRTGDYDTLDVGREGSLWIFWGGWCFEFPHARIVGSTRVAHDERHISFLHPRGARPKRLVHRCGTLVALRHGRSCLGCGAPWAPHELLPTRLRTALRSWQLGIVGDDAAIGADWFEVLLDAAEDGWTVPDLRQLVAGHHRLERRATLRDVNPEIRAVIERQPGCRSASLVELLARQTIEDRRSWSKDGIVNFDKAFSHQLRLIRPRLHERCRVCHDRCGSLRHDGRHAVAEVCECTTLWPDVFEFELGMPGG